MRTIFLMRHGAILQRHPRRFVGQTDFPLIEEGRGQAALWRDALAEVPFDAVVTSDLVRCRETAAIVLEGRGVPVRADSRLREIRLGGWEGLTVEEVHERFPGAYERRGLDLAGFHPVDGESFVDVQHRAVPVIEELAGPDGNVLVVAHGGVNRTILCHALGIPLDYLFRLGQRYCGLNLISLHPESWHVDAINLAPVSPWRFPGP